MSGRSREEKRYWGPEDFVNPQLAQGGPVH